VHRGYLLDGTEVAIKVQYPGVARSIDSDLNNLKSLIAIADIIPKGMFIDQIIRVARVELTAECEFVILVFQSVLYMIIILHR
jgi:aarF domain-containing kinase